MKKLVQTLLVSFIFLSTIASAHPEGHGKPRTIHKEQAITTASYYIKRLVEKGELEKSWELIKATQAVFERRDSRMNWIVSFDNPKAAEKSKSKFFVFLTNTGYLISTGYTDK